MTADIEIDRLDPRDHPPDASLAWLEARGADPPAARRLLTAVLGEGHSDPESINRRSQVPLALARRIDLGRSIRLDSLATSAADGFQKLAFRTHDDESIESVLIPLHKPGSVSLCLSSQVGCPMACTFCATARMPRRRNLATWEIVDQWLQCRRIVRDQGRRVTGIVFMGMGEPFLNYDRVLAAAELMRCPTGGGISGKAITISTVGLVPEIDRFTAEGRRFRLSISLGAAIDAKRREILPVAGRTPVATLMDAARRHQAARGGRVMLSYVCIGGFNTGEEDADALGHLIGSTPVRLSLIEVTDPTGRFRPPDAEELRAFRDALTRHLGQPVHRRYSGGAEIDGACGTLAGRLAR